MIRFILLLPIKLLGLVFMAIGGAIDAHRRRAAEAERLRIAQAKEEQRAMERGARIAAARAKEAERKRADQARAEATEARRAEAEQLRAAKAAERVREADADLAHLEAMRADCQRLAEYAEALLDRAETDSQKEAATKRLMAANQRLRNVDRQRERLQFVVNQGGR